MMKTADMMVIKLEESISYYKDKVTVSEIVGALELIKSDVIQEARDLD
jgi:hypothetical protein